MVYLSKDHLFNTLPSRMLFKTLNSVERDRVVEKKKDNLMRFELSIYMHRSLIPLFHMAWSVVFSHMFSDEFQFSLSYN